MELGWTYGACKHYKSKKGKGAIMPCRGWALKKGFGSYSICGSVNQRQILILAGLTTVACLVVAYL